MRFFATTARVGDGGATAVNGWGCKQPWPTSDPSMAGVAPGQATWETDGGGSGVRDPTIWSGGSMLFPFFPVRVGERT